MCVSARASRVCVCAVFARAHHTARLPWTGPTGPSMVAADPEGPAPERARGGCTERRHGGRPSCTAVGTWPLSALLRPGPVVGGAVSLPGPDHVRLSPTSGMAQFGVTGVGRCAIANLTADGANMTTNSSKVLGTRPEEPPSMVIVCIIMGLGASVAINIGQNLQALGLQGAGAEKAKDNPCKSRTWVLGMTVSALCPQLRRRNASRHLVCRRPDSLV